MGRSGVDEGQGGDRRKNLEFLRKLERKKKRRLNPTLYELGAHARLYSFESAGTPFFYIEDKVVFEFVIIVTTLTTSEPI